MFANVITLSPRRAWADWAGLIASIGCAVHCAVMPLVLAYLPSFGLSWLADEMFHRWMAVLWARRGRIYTRVAKTQELRTRDLGRCWITSSDDGCIWIGRKLLCILHA